MYFFKLFGPFRSPLFLFNKNLEAEINIKKRTTQTKPVFYRVTSQAWLIEDSRPKISLISSKLIGLSLTHDYRAWFDWIQHFLVKAQSLLLTIYIGTNDCFVWGCLLYPNGGSRQNPHEHFDYDIIINIIMILIYKIYLAIICSDKQRVVTYFGPK